MHSAGGAVSPAVTPTTWAFKPLRIIESPQRDFTREEMFEESFANAKKLTFKLLERKADEAMSLLDSLSVIQSRYMSLTDKLKEFEEENQRLRDKIHQQEDWELIKSSYQEFYIDPGILVMRRESNEKQPVKYACPNCFSEKKEAVMYGKNIDGYEFLTCTSCGIKLPVSIDGANVFLNDAKNN
jgi:predicted RNA-binding Zn-ribbon protein involved in translation (DUF1610 family)